MKSTLLTRFELSLAGLPQIVGKATPEQLRQRSLPEKWSALENLAHLAHFTLVTQDRMARILQEEGPPDRAAQTRHRTGLFVAARALAPRGAGRTQKA
ncbi:MAG: hypothetical protein KatS3mg072_1304 [Meiothermus sp.]|nr:DinB family protein [Meiothermus sp.]GIW33971.1 MAG: hypothetical protein KatS3mg072_1304 [Meiothermus sp.]